MYEVWVYDEPLGSFIPARGIDNRRLSFQSWQDAEDMRVLLRVSNPSNQYKVEYATVRRRKGNR